MSVSYVIREHLMIEDTKEQLGVARMMNYHLSLLGAWLLQDRVNVYRFTVLADGEEYDYSSVDMTNYQKVMAAFAKATKAEVLLHYEYNYSFPEVDPGPFDLNDYLKELAEIGPENLEGIFYSMYYNEDCSDGEGFVRVYGQKNGVMYTGTLPFVPVSEIPAGQWYTEETSVGCDIGTKDGYDLQSIERVCRALAVYDDDYTLDITEDEFSFYLNTLTFESDAQFKHFVGLCGQLKALLGEECFILGAVTEISGPDLKMLHFTVDEAGKYTMELASVD